MSIYLSSHENHTSFSQSPTADRAPTVHCCNDERHVHYNRTVRANGHAYVDLGLPSGTLWATMNIGATTEDVYGQLFMWGEVTGKKITRHDENYPYIAHADEQQYPRCDYTKYVIDEGTGYRDFMDNKSVLDLVDDAAHVAWGGDWHMPYKEQCLELINNTENYWDDTRKGYVFNGNGNSMFMPAAGGASVHTETGYEDRDKYGYYWANSLRWTAFAWTLLFWEPDNNYPNGGIGHDYDNGRTWAMSVRGVIGYPLPTTTTAP